MKYDPVEIACKKIEAAIIGLNEDEAVRVVGSALVLLISGIPCATCRTDETRRFLRMLQKSLQAIPAEMDCGRADAGAMN